MARLRAEQKKAEEDSAKLVGQLDTFLKQNHQIV